MTYAYSHPSAYPRVDPDPDTGVWIGRAKCCTLWVARPRPGTVMRDPETGANRFATAMEAWAALQAAGYRRTF